MSPLPSVMPHRSQPIPTNAFELEWSFPHEVNERDVLSSVDRYRRMVLAGGGMVQRCDVDAGSRTGPHRLVRMAVHCDRSTLASVQSEMLSNESISLHLVRRVEPALQPQLASAHNEPSKSSLGSIGFAPPAVDALNALIEKRIAEQMRSQPAYATAPLRMLGAREVGIRLGNLSDQTVRIREKDKKLFSLLQPNRQRGREYPEYQLEQGIHGRPLSSVLKILGDAGGEVVHSFFITRVASLGDLSPLEVLRGHAFGDGPVDQLLGQPADQRLTAVLNAADAFLRSTLG